VQATEDSATGLRARHTVVIFLVSLAGLLLEVGYTRIVSFKLYYYYVYLVLGLALLGIGSGGIFVVVFPRLRRAATDSVVAACALVGAISIAIGYFVVARIPIDTIRMWDYGTKSSLKNFVVLGVVCFTLFASFVPLGIIVSTLLGRGGSRVGGLYFADLVGAGLGCVLAIPLIVSLGPPQVLMLSALIFAVVGLVAVPRRLGPRLVAGALVVLLGLGTVGFGIPDVRPEVTKASPQHAAYSDWGPVFRVDVAEIRPEFKSLFHDGTFGSIIPRFDGNARAVTRFNDDPRSLPFGLLGNPADHTLIIGSAGGNEIVAALHYQSKKIDGVELNPVTVDLVRNRYKQYSGDLAHQPGVNIHQGDGRSYLARSNDNYDLVWFVAPDSYAANNAASSGAFVLSESYLYTTQMIEESLKHLTDRGVMVVQFGELDFTNAPNRTARYVMTARRAFKEMGIKDPGAHMIVSPYITHKTGDLATIMLKRTAFTPEEVARYQQAISKVSLSTTAWAPGLPKGPGIVPRLIDASDAKAAAVAATYPRQVSAISDDGPFFWHFSSFSDVIRNFTDPIDPIDPSIVLGERVLLLLLGIAIVFAAVFLLLPFFFVRKEWRALPAKGISALYFAALGLGFILFEISMIQRLVLFLGYPTYSLTVTLASLLVFTGIGALWSNRLAPRARVVVPVVFLVLCALTAFYELGLDGLKDGLLSEGLAVRVTLVIIVLAPLGLCLGMFMPLGLGIVSGLSDHPDEYVAWSWAVNGFFSVIGSVLTTILAMSFGFRLVQLVALGIYGVAVLAFFRLRTRSSVAVLDPVGP
jgi:Spermidine synthase